MGTYYDTSNTRVWTIKNRAGPANAPAYQSCMKASSPMRPRGEPTIITCPDPQSYGQFKVVGKIPGDIGLPGITLMSRYTEDISALLEFNRKGCDVDIQVLVGRCRNPQDFNEGWTKKLVIEGAQPGDWGITEFGALEQGDQAAINEEMPFKGEEMYEIKRIIFEEQAESENVQEVLAILICDTISCGECDNPSDGCEKVFALTITVGGSPGAKAEVIFTQDGGTTWGDTEVDSLDADKDPTDMACVGPNIVVISNDDDSLHWAPKDDILEETETWTEVTTGIVAAGSPNAIISLSPRHTWIVGDGGYVYFTEDPTAGVTVQSAGTVATQDLKAIHGYDTNNLVAVGDSNEVIYTRNGGDTWVAVTGPNAAVNLSSVWMRGVDEWFIGCADGKLYYTLDAGTNWTQKVLPNQSNISDIEDIKFSTPTVGWLSAELSTTAGRIYRTTDGGYSWYVAPEGGASIPANDSINEIAVCDYDANVIYAGGLADDASDGIILKGS